MNRMSSTQRSEMAEQAIVTSTAFLALEKNTLNEIKKTPEKNYAIEKVANLFKSPMETLRLFDIAERIRFQFENNFDKDNKERMLNVYNSVRAIPNNLEILSEQDKLESVEELLVVIYAAIEKNQDELVKLLYKNYNHNQDNEIER